MPSDSDKARRWQIIWGLVVLAVVGFAVTRRVLDGTAWWAAGRTKEERAAFEEAFKETVKASKDRNKAIEDLAEP